MFRFGTKLNKKKLKVLLLNHQQIHERVFETIFSLNKQAFNEHGHIPKRVVKIIYSYIIASSQSHESFDKCNHFNHYFGVFHATKDLEWNYIPKAKLQNASSRNSKAVLLNIDDDCDAQMSGVPYYNISNDECFWSNVELVST